MVPQWTTWAAEPVNQVRPLRNTAAAYLEVLVVAWMEEKVCLSIILLERGKNWTVRPEAGPESKKSV